VLAGLVLLGAAAATDAQTRPFRHAPHAELSCRGCHAYGQRHRSPREWTPADCASCHHDPVRALACTRCHQPGDYEPLRDFPARMALSVRDVPETRALPFSHSRHEQLSCQSCHDASATDALMTPPQCVSCHTDHHRPDANCATCHFPKGPEVHGLEVHLTCAGAGCHTLPPERTLVLSRTFCLMCHTEQQDHEPAGLCHKCHFLKDEG
jgi:hypothetical protein